MKLAFADEESVVMHDPPAGGVELILYDRMTHFVVDDVIEKPRRHKSPVEQWMNADDAIVFLDCAEDDAASRALPAFAPPKNRVATQTIAKITRIQLREMSSQIEKAALFVE